MPIKRDKKSVKKRTSKDIFPRLKKGEKVEVSSIIDKRGAERAYYLSRRQSRWFPLPVKDMRILLKEKKARYVKKSEVW